MTGMPEIFLEFKKRLKDLRQKKKTNGRYSEGMYVRVYINIAPFKYLAEVLCG